MFRGVEKRMYICNYVALTDMLDKESILYMVNIADHGVEPMKQSIVTVRQLMQYLQTMIGIIQEQRVQY